MEEQTSLLSDSAALLFPTYSSTLLIGPSYSGKTTFLLNLLESHPVYFGRPPGTVHVFQNGKAAEFPEIVPDKNVSKLNVERYEADEYNEDLLEVGDVVIFEDVSQITDDIRQCLNVHTHHKGVYSFFIVHSTFRSRLYDIYSLVHRVLFFCANGTVARQASYIIGNYFTDTYTRTILKNALAFAEREKEILQVELNSPSQLRPLQILALTHVRQLSIKNKEKESQHAYAFLHPYERAKIDKLWERAGHALDDISKGITDPDIPFPLAPTDKMLPDQTPESAFVLVPASLVRAWYKADLTLAKSSVTESRPVMGEATKAEEEKAFHDAADAIQGLIEDTMPARQHFAAKALAKEILKSKAISLSDDGREIWITGSEEGATVYDDSEESLAEIEYGHDFDHKVPIIDFLSVATRRTTPQEAKKRGKDWKRYAEIVQQLLLNKCPRLLFKNATLLKMSAVGKKAHKRNERDCCRYHAIKSKRKKDRQKRK